MGHYNKTYLAWVPAQEEEGEGLAVCGDQVPCVHFVCIPERVRLPLLPAELQTTEEKRKK